MAILMNKKSGLRRLIHLVLGSRAELMNVIGYQEQIIHQLAPYIGQVDEQQVEMHQKFREAAKWVHPALALHLAHKPRIA